MKKLKIYTIITILLLILSVSLSEACLEIERYPWFTLSYKLISDNLPNGIVVKSQKDDLYIEKVYIKNESEIPIYLENYSFNRFFKVDYYDKLGNKTKLKPSYKLVNSKVYYWQVKQKQSGEWGGEWTESRSISNLNKEGFLDYDLSRLSSNYDYSIDTTSTLHFETRSINSVSQKFESRADDVSIPEPFELIIPVFYKDKELNLKVIGEYSLNEEYKKNPEGESLLAKNEEPCSDK